MKRSVIGMLVLALMVSAPILVLAGYGGSGGSHAAAGFEKLKSLAGEWEMTGGEDGAVTHVSYKIVSKGSAVVETIQHTDEPDMITVYHVDGDRLMMTHYCGLANQPRMKATVPDGDVKELTFKFIDGTNMKKNDMHMHGLKLSFIDDTHVKAVWSLYDKGKLSQDVEFTYARVQ